MKYPFTTKFWFWVLVAALAFHTREVIAQQRRRVVEEPRWLKFRINEVSTGVYGEARFDETLFTDSDTSIRYDRVFIGPSLGLTGSGSIYHPNLARFYINTEGAYGWATETVEAGGTSTSRNQMQYLGRFIGNLDLLANKPYSANVFGNYDHTFRDYDFFNRVTVDSLRYGSTIRYATGPWALNATYSHQEEETSGLAGFTTSADDTFVLQGTHTREAGSTTASYAYNQYTRADFGVDGNGGDHAFTVADFENFGSRRQFRLNSNLGFYSRDAFDEPSQELHGSENLTIEHRPNLTSFYDVDYSRYESGNLTSDNYFGQGQLRHRLYDSLTSTLIGQASNYELSDRFSSGHSRRFGGGFTEEYTKQLGPDHRLRIFNSFILEHVDQESIRTVENERHTFDEVAGGAGTGSFFLNLPNVIQSTIEVTSPNDSFVYVRGFDYSVVTLGSRTLIQRIPGSRIPEGAAVFVDYQTEPQASGSYESFTEVFQVRFDLWKNLIGVYARMNLYGNNAPDRLFAQNLTSYTFGSDVNWKWFRAGAEYEIYDSDDSDFTSFRLFQSLAFQPDSSSSLGIELSESWTDYKDAGRTEENYRFITRYNRTMSQRLRANIEGGIHVRRGRDVEQTLATARPGVEYQIGKTTIRAGYDYEYRLFLDREERNKHFLFVRLRRVF